MCADVPAGSAESALAALLDWYAAVGVDIAVDDAPHDRFAESERAMRPAPGGDASAPRAGSFGAERSAPSPPTRAAAAPPPGGPRGGAAPVFPEEAARAAQAAASGAAGLNELRQALEAFDGCALKATAGHFVFAAGAPGARLMVLEFSPGEEEERSGEAFVGREARLLDNMLAAIGLDRKTAYLAYATPWRPPGGRELSAPETASLLPFLQRHVELAGPDILLILGDNAAKAALGSSDVAKLRGAWFDYPCGDRSIRAMLSPGLSSLLKTPVFKRRAWRDLRSVASALR